MTRGSHGSEGVENEKGVAGLGVCSEILEYNLTSTSRGVLPIWQSISRHKSFTGIRWPCQVMTKNEIG